MGSSYVFCYENGERIQDVRPLPHLKMLPSMIPLPLREGLGEGWLDKALIPAPPLPNPPRKGEGTDMINARLNSNVIYVSTNPVSALSR